MNKQVFQTESRSRWNKFRLSLGLIILIAILLLSVFVTMLFLDRIPSIPFHEDYSTAMMATHPYMKKTKLSKEYRGYRNYFKENKAHTNYVKWAQTKIGRIQRFGGRTDSYIAEWNAKKAGVRAAFYVTWDPQSYVSLKASMRNLNLVIPEWFFINPQTSKLEVQIDARGYKLMKNAGIPVMPMVSNAWNGKFQTKGVIRLLRDEKLRGAFIDSTLQQCLRHHFVGLNIDIEELPVGYKDLFTRFVKELSDKLHAHGLYVMQDIMPFNKGYDVKSLAKYNDYLMLMAYDEHMTLTEPGPVSSQQWTEKVLDDLADKIPTAKILLGIGAYGYDWTPKNDNNQSITFHDAMSLAADTQSPINFDNNTYSLNFAYNDNHHITHTVYFNDAATNFNTLRFGCEYGIAGFGVWRLGSEDKRLWEFYNKDLSMPAVERLRMGDLEHLHGSKSATYLGEGEVLDVIGTPHDGSVRIDMDNDGMLIAEEKYEHLPMGYELMKYGDCGKKDLLLTFDDGPNSRWTPEILKILKKYNVHVSFFMVGLMMEKNLPLVKQVFEDGHIIGNHTFTHHNVAENTPQRTYMELRLTRLLLECVTGHSSILFRAPYNADSDPSGSDELIPLAESRTQNYIDVGESIDPNDWEPGVTADEIFHRVIKGVEQGTGHIILLHDAGGTTREATVEALPRIIDYLQHRGYRFITLPQYLGKSSADLMPAIPKGKEYYAMQANLTLVESIYEIGNVIAALFFIFLVVGIGRLLFMLMLTFRERRMEHQMDALLTSARIKDYPLVSIIVPAYNEEVDVVSSLQNLLKKDYPNYDIIFVDDGSKDATYQRVCETFAGNGKMKLLTKPNGGKASALNFGISHTQADYVVCIDADTKLKADAVSVLMRHFFADKEERVGAVAGNVKIGNQCNMLTHWQAIEYTTSQNFDRMAYSAINAITVVPGAIGAFRKSAILKSGGLTTDTLAEDCDLTIRILKSGYKVENENRAVAMTEAPEKLGQFIKQRTRWCFGIMQTFWKNRGAMFDYRYKGLGLWALPNMLLFQFIIPTFSPIADILMILGLFSGNVGKVLLYYFVFLLVDASVSIMAYLHERERLWVLFWIIPQRFCYRWIMYVVLFKSYKKAVKGELQSWGVLKRTGKVKDL